MFLDEISRTQKSIKVMKKDFKTALENLLTSTTFFKGVVLKIWINRSVIEEEKLVLKRHQKKLDNLLKEKNKLNDIYGNSNTVVTNLASHVLSNEEYNILKFRLKYGLATRPNESDILPYAEDIWEQIDKSNICHNEFYSKSKIKNALRRLAFNLINFEDACIFKDSKKIKIIQWLQENVAVLKVMV